MIEEDVAFQSVWSIVSFDPITVTSTFLVEFFSDDTDDAGDYWQMCIDGDQSGGAAPQAGDMRIDIVGNTDLIVYEGDGEGWTEVTIDPASLEWASSISASPHEDTPHWILEMKINKQSLGAGPTWNFRLAVYDESTDTLLAWPPTDRDVPNGYGVQNYVSEVIPEGFGLGFVALLSSVAVVASVFLLRKRPKTQG
jgi:hypothetical protein